MRPKIIINRIRCRNCGDIIESAHTHDYRQCSCKKVTVDGGKEYLKRIGDSMDFEELSETLNHVNHNEGKSEEATCSITETKFEYGLSYENGHDEEVTKVEIKAIEEAAKQVESGEFTSLEEVLTKYQIPTTQIPLKAINHCALWSCGLSDLDAFHTNLLLCEGS